MNPCGHVIITQSPQCTSGSLLVLHTLWVFTNVWRLLPTMTVSHKVVLLPLTLCAPPAPLPPPSSALPLHLQPSLSILNIPLNPQPSLSVLNLHNKTSLSIPNPLSISSTLLSIFNPLSPSLTLPLCPQPSLSIVYALSPPSMPPLHPQPSQVSLSILIPWKPLISYFVCSSAFSRRSQSWNHRVSSPQTGFFHWVKHTEDSSMSSWLGSSFLFLC